MFHSFHQVDDLYFKSAYFILQKIEASSMNKEP